MDVAGGKGPADRQPTGAPGATGAAALIAGVESYAAGPSWDLDGPVRDALAYRDWLLSCLGMAPQAVTLLLSPLPGSLRLVEDAGAVWRRADQECVRHAVFQELAAESSEWLFVAWSGRGLVDRDGRRRLLCADATEHAPRCLDLEAALAAFRPDAAPEHPRQLWLVDVHGQSPGGVPRPGPAHCGRPHATRGQQVLFAISPGGQRRPGGLGGPRGPGGTTAGRFGAEAQRLLRAHPEWRYDSRQLADALRERFASAMTASADVAAPARASARPRLTLDDRRRLYEALAAVPVMQDPGLRAAVIDQLPPEIASSVPRSPVMRVEILELIGTCAAFEHGLRHLWEAVSLLDAGSLALADLERTLRGTPEWCAPD
ncbi:effector-associated domain 2-containing protein [Streptomyces sp. PR69]|uniref:effector-associated domain 2-containing protein n=1 Tax=Streptomyces sp. PR69 TaxID=2984950 RepID=UPI002263F638|nr:hypothetical protein [Streptomyces sp. PR69]